MNTSYLNIDPITLGDTTYEKVRAYVGTYFESAGNAVQLECDIEGYWEPLTTLTVNVPGLTEPGSRFAWARDSEENEGLLDQLEAQGLIERTGHIIPQGFIRLHEIELLEPLATMAEANPLAT